MKIINNFNILDTGDGENPEVKCEQAEYCTTYLEYLGKYVEGSKEIKMCKNSDSDYCTKYQLINQTKWNSMTTEEKVKLVKDVIIIDNK